MSFDHPFQSSNLGDAFEGLLTCFDWNWNISFPGFYGPIRCPLWAQRRSLNDLWVGYCLWGSIGCSKSEPLRLLLRKILNWELKLYSRTHLQNIWVTQNECPLSVQATEYFSHSKWSPLRGRDIAKFGCHKGWVSA